MFVDTLIMLLHRLPPYICILSRFCSWTQDEAYMSMGCAERYCDVLEMHSGDSNLSCQRELAPSLSLMILCCLRSSDVNVWMCYCHVILACCFEAGFLVARLDRDLDPQDDILLEAGKIRC